jgi:uncharacterized protein (TIGR00290 family)
MEDSFMHVMSWSGGKDSCHALHRALGQGLEVTTIVNLISDDHERVRFHGTRAALIKEQADLLGLGLYQRKTPADDYEGEFKNALRELKEKGATDMLFGDIYVDEHREWVERVCGEMGMKAHEPLWGGETEALVRGFIDAGFEAHIVCVNGRLIDPQWSGRLLSHEFIDYLIEKRLDPCGEKGEYHSFVTSGPIFNGSIDITRAETVEIDGYYFSDIREYETAGAALGGARGPGARNPV